MLKEQFIADRKVLKTNHNFKVCFIANTDWFCRLSREAFAKGLQNVWKGLKSVCKGFEKHLQRVWEAFAKGLRSVWNALQTVWEAFPKGLKRCQIPFVRRFKRLKNAVFDKTCFPMEGHIFYESLKIVDYDGLFTNVKYV